MYNEHVRYFWNLVYKDDSGFYPNGQQRQISCDHQLEATMGITTRGEIVPLPGATLPPGTSYGNSIQSGSAMVPADTVNGATNQFTDVNYKTVVRIKDFTNNNVTSWVDAVTYYANVVVCNPSTHN